MIGFSGFIFSLSSYRKGSHELSPILIWRFGREMNPLLFGFRPFDSQEFLVAKQTP